MNDATLLVQFSAVLTSFGALGLVLLFCLQYSAFRRTGRTLAYSPNQLQALTHARDGSFVLEGRVSIEVDLVGVFDLLDNVLFGP